ncbi:hypothetical protein LMG19083_02280 [Ralstonia psammae]|uniref:Uncharacterized protein n=1 Tax=Ralstonia psammae TaxID=3058598 RepID=A0ABM9JGA0_9RALS|nr:hypothetical protein [Ralstonia sp. LMG 19083]CAJ0792354.1 hypothetical protein LMG19083_02280 [Ralstonia sp. LMG 19083]
MRERINEAERTCLRELQDALTETLPRRAVLRLEGDELDGIDVHAWWIVEGQHGDKQVNSFSFHLTEWMLQAYFHQSSDARARTCGRLKDWANWALDGAEEPGDSETGFDICACVPGGIFHPAGDPQRP